MRSRERRQLAIGAAVLVSGAISTAALLRPRPIPRFAYIGQALAPRDYETLAARVGWRGRTRVIRIASGAPRGPGAIGAAADEIVLRGLERPPSIASAPWILFFDGNTAHPLENGQRVLDALAGDRGWGAVLWAYRGYDGSGGAPTPEDLLSDGWAEYKGLLNDEALDPSRVHLIGFSLGTSIAAAVAARAHGAAPASVTLLAPMSELEMISRVGHTLHRYETLKYLADMDAPTLIVHGALDKTLPTAGGRQVALRLGPRARYVELPDCGHLDLLSSPATLEAVRSFLVENAHATLVHQATP
jgi:uncharacterized protein